MSVCGLHILIRSFLPGLRWRFLRMRFAWGAGPPARRKGSLTLVRDRSQPSCAPGPTSGACAAGDPLRSGRPCTCTPGLADGQGLQRSVCALTQLLRRMIHDH